MSPNPRALNIPEGTSGKKRQALLYLYSLSKGASFFRERRGVGWDGGSTPLDHRRSLSVPFTAHCPPGSRRSPALDSNSAAPGSRPGVVGKCRGSLLSHSETANNPIHLIICSGLRKSNNGGTIDFPGRHN